jgi:hypothetical protein
MEIATEYEDPKSLREYVNMIFTTDLICRLNLSLDGVKSAVEFFVSNWHILKLHYAPVTVASCCLFAGFSAHSSSKKTRKIIMDRFGISLSSVKACLFDVLKKRGIPVNYGIREPEHLVLAYYSVLTTFPCIPNTDL